MTARTLILRSLRFRWRAHLGVVLGAAVGSAALIGALVVGDSVRASLRQRALQRLGHIRFALFSEDRLFRSALARDLEQAFRTEVSSGTGVRLASALKLPATAARTDGAARANAVQLIGVDDPIVPIAGSSVYARLPEDAVLLNGALAAQLGVAVGDTVLFRGHKLSALSVEAPISPQSDAGFALRLKVRGIVPPEAWGDFGLAASQLPPLNAFVSLAVLQQATAAPRRANLLFLARGSPGEGREGSTLEIPIVNQHLTKTWQLEDLQLSLRRLTNQGGIELTTTRIFLDPPVAQAALAAASNAQPILTYFVNQFRAGTNTAPYSMVTAAGPPWTPADLRDDEILVNQWLGDDLKVAPGDGIELTWFRPDSGARLVEASNRFRLRGIVPLRGIHADRNLMPEFPGLAKAESTHDWDAGFPLVHKIRTKDEDYWKEFRGTPKAFISPAAGQRLWANRFGELTAIRWETPAGSTPEVLAREIETNLLRRLKPWEVGLRFEPAREQALQAASQSQDFGGLFIGFSFFLIAAALILVGLLFLFGVEQRAGEVGTLLALGFTPGQVRRLLLGEGVALSLAGGLAGAAGGLAYAWGMLQGLATIWREAVGAAALNFHATPLTLCVGLVSAVAVGTLTIWLALRRQARQPARALLSGEGQMPIAARRGRGLWIGSGGLLGAAALVGWALWKKETANAELFFSAGTLCLVGGLGLIAWWLARERATTAGPHSAGLSLSSLALRGCTRRRNRSLAVAALLACGVFIIASIGVFRLEAGLQAWKRASGTGGFALVGQSTLPVVKDLNTSAGLESFGLDGKDLAGVSFVPLRVRDGDEASCLNLNRAQKPRLLGVKPELLADRSAFTFSRLARGIPAGTGWLALKPGRSEPRPRAVAGPETSSPSGSREIPAIGDAASLEWALGKKIGDTLEYTDERGQPFRLRLVGAVANSILQGSLLIDEDEFVRKFPSEAGWRMILIDAPSNRLGQVSAALSRGLRDLGLELIPAARRLAQFNAVQNTYLSTFQVLGGLGLLLGSAGLGVVVLRNVFERRAELALLLAVGFKPRRVRRLVLQEHLLLLLLGLALGVGAAAVAVVPSLAPTAELPWRSLAVTLGGVLATGLTAALAGTWLALRGPLLDALRSE